METTPPVMTPILPAGTGTTIVTEITSMIGANLPLILPLVAFGIGLTVVRGFLNRAKKGKV